MAVEFKVGVVKTGGYKELDCGSRYVGWKETGFVLEVEFGGREGFLHVTRGVEGFDVQGSVVGKLGCPVVLRCRLTSLVSLRRMELLAKGLR